MFTTKRVEKYVSNRRMQEERTNFLASKLKQEFHLRELAKFENKGKDVAQVKYVKKRLTELREHHLQNIDSKRLKLKNLLDRENEEYRNAIANLEETPEQVRERMIQRVQELRENKETKRQQEVAEKLDRKFRGEADELRKVESELNEIKNAYQRDLQLVEKQRLLQQQYEEDMLYAELWKRDAMRKEKKEQDELEERKRRNDERNQILNWQKEVNTQQRQEELQRIEAEKQMMRENWLREEQKQRELEEKNLHTNKELNRELYQHNIEQRMQKTMMVQAEKESDKQMIQSIIEREKMLEAIEKEAKEQQKKQTREFLLNSKNRTNELHSQEAELERLIQEEAEKQYRKQQEQWKKEEESKIKLLYNVYDSRAQDIERKKKLMEDQKIEKQIDKEIITKDILDYEDAIRRKKEEEWRRNKLQQTAVLNQMDQKRESQQRSFQTKLEQERAEVQAQMEYLRKVQLEKERGRRMLEDMRRHRPF